MKLLLRLLVLVSVAANVVLVVNLHRRLAAAGADRDAQAPVAAQRKARHRPVARVVTQAEPAPQAASASPAAFHWSQLESEDYEQYRANLVAVGCPPSTVKDILRADINQLFDERRREALKSFQREFWTVIAPPLNVFSSPRLKEVEKTVLLVEEERRRVLRQLLGENEHSVEVLEYSSPVFPETEDSFLSEEKHQAIEALRQRFQQDVDALGKLKLDEKERKAEVKRLAEELRARIASLLTPEEFAEYEARVSPTASRVRQALGDFEPTDEEFRAFMELQRRLESREQEQGGAGAKGGETYQSLAKELLSPERLAEFTWGQNQILTAARDITDHFGLPAQAALDVVQEREQARLRVEQILTRGDAGSESATEALRQARTETEAALRGVLGDQAFEVYRRNEMGWFDSLTRVPKPSSNP